MSWDLGNTGNLSLQDSPESWKYYSTPKPDPKDARAETTTVDGVTVQMRSKKNTNARKAQNRMSMRMSRKDKVASIAMASARTDRRRLSVAVATNPALARCVDDTVKFMDKQLRELGEK